MKYTYAPTAAHLLADGETRLGGRLGHELHGHATGPNAQQLARPRRLRAFVQRRVRGGKRGGRHSLFRGELRIEV